MRSVKRTLKGEPATPRTGSDAKISATRRKPITIRARSRSSSMKLNSTSGAGPPSPGLSETRPRAIGRQSTGARFAMRRPSAFHDVLLWMLM